MKKYMKKLKITGDLKIMELTHSSPFSVRTRAAKTLALQRLTSTAYISSPPPPTESCAEVSYLQLRSRRLEKHPVLEMKKHQKSREAEGKSGRNTEKAGLDEVVTGRVRFVPLSRCRDGDECLDNCGDSLVGDSNFDFCGIKEGNEAELETSLGENGLACDPRDRGSRESTPCNFIKDPDAVATPSSTVRRTCTSTTYQMPRDNTQRTMPSTRELEEFFAYAEQQQQRVLMEKYNFDIVNDKPLSGRYEWVQVVP